VYCDIPLTKSTSISSVFCLTLLLGASCMFCKSKKRIIVTSIFIYINSKTQRTRFSIILGVVYMYVGYSGT